MLKHNGKMQTHGETDGQCKQSDGNSKKESTGNTKTKNHEQKWRMLLLNHQRAGRN